MAKKDKTRKSITKKQREDILKRDNYTCGYCGKRKKISSLAIDHIIPVRKGGFHGTENWVASCKGCNRTKWHYGPNEKSASKLIFHRGRRVAKCSWMAKGKKFPARIPRIAYKKT